VEEVPVVTERLDVCRLPDMDIRAGKYNAFPDQPTDGEATTMPKADRSRWLSMGRTTNVEKILSVVVTSI
jgi:hypothetical protein